MASEYNFYGGSTAGLEPDFENPISHYVNSGSISLAVDPRTANQLKEVSGKLSSGAKAIEVQLTIPKVAESIPNQHLDEINRLRKLVGAELTLHGPLIDPTGIGEERWEESKRVQAERQMWSALQRAHKVNPDGNVVVTFHTSNGLPQPQTEMLDEKGEKTVTRFSVIDERTGNYGSIPISKEDYYTGEKKSDPKKELEMLNKENWFKELSNVNIEASRARREFLDALDIMDKKPELAGEGKKGLLEWYDKMVNNPDTYQKQMSILERESPEIASNLKKGVSELSYAHVFIKDAYGSLKKLYNQAYFAAERDKNDEDKKKLEKFRDEVSKLTEESKKNPKKIFELSDEINKGIQMLGSIKEPKIFRPIDEFAIEQASETFSNLAFNAYDEFGKTSPVISVENPPAGSGLDRAEQMKQLIEESRKKFVEKAVDSGKLGRSEAEEQAEKLIGATWDVGHINMLRKYGFQEKHLIEETKKIAPYVKNIHLSDNFGLDHTELPMGMGNVPIQKHMDVLRKQYGEKLNQIKKVVETGDWYQHFQTAPFVETLSAFGSPIYGMQMSPYWNQGAQTQAGYSAGLGYNPDVHHSIYGAGFSGLPSELGGQSPGGRSRFSGTPTE